MIDVTEQFKEVDGIVKAESEGKNTLVLVKLQHRIKRFDGKMAGFELRYYWHRMDIETDNMHDVHSVLGDDYSYWLKKEINFEKGLFEQFNLF
jgi:hypothetical protein